MDRKLIEASLLAFVNNQQLNEALSYLDEYPELIDLPTVETASCISLLLLVSESYEDCILFSEHHLKSLASADLHYNLAFAYEQIGNYLMAIKNYQCARLFSLDMAFRVELSEKIVRLRFHDHSESTIQDLIAYYHQERTYVKAQLLKPNVNLNPNDYINLKFPINAYKPSILLGTMEIANHISHYIKYFRGQDFIVLGIDYVPNYLNYDLDFSQKLDVIAPENASELRLLNTVDLISDFDIFHFVFNTSLAVNCTDLIPLKRLGKKVFMHNLGSEIRIPEIARGHHPYWQYAEDYLSALNGDQIKQNIHAIASWIDHSIINDYEMRSYVQNDYKHVHMIGLPINLEAYTFSPQIKRPFIHVVHAPTNRSVKGSIYFEKAVQELSKKYPIKYTRVEKMDHHEAMKFYRDADIVLDELIIGTYGSLTIECMAMGRCVATFINPSFLTPHNEEIPVWSVNIDNLIPRLDELMGSFELRESLSLKARAYVERNNDIKIIGTKLLEVYKK